MTIRVDIYTKCSLWMLCGANTSYNLQSYNIIVLYFVSYFDVDNPLKYKYLEVLCRNMELIGSIMKPVITIVVYYS